MMDAQSPAAVDMPGAAAQPPILLEHPVGDPPEAGRLRPVQELRNYTHHLKEHIREFDAAVHLMESVCEENDEATEANR